MNFQACFQPYQWQLTASGGITAFQTGHHQQFSCFSLDWDKQFLDILHNVTQYFSFRRLYYLFQQSKHNVSLWWPGGLWNIEVLHELLSSLFKPIFGLYCWYISLVVRFWFCFSFKHLYWSIIALQWCVSFGFMTNWISYTYTYDPISLPSCISIPPTLPISPLYVVTKHRADLPVLCSCFPLGIYFTFDSVYMSMPLSHFVPAYPSPSPYPQVHSLVGLHLYSHLAPRFFWPFSFLFFLSF